MAWWIRCGALPHGRERSPLCLSVFLESHFYSMHSSNLHFFPPMPFHGNRKEKGKGYFRFIAEKVERERAGGCKHGFVLA